jgi:hypothetical protein
VAEQHFSTEIARAVIHDTRLAILVLCGGSRTTTQIREDSN